MDLVCRRFFQCSEGSKVMDDFTFENYRWSRHVTWWDESLENCSRKFMPEFKLAA